MKKILTQEILDILLTDIDEFRRLFKLNKKPPTFTKEDEIYHMSLAVEELTELADAETLSDKADALTDLLYVHIGHLYHRNIRKLNDDPSMLYLVELILQSAKALNIDLLKCWDIVHASNISKICKNHEEYRQTALYYKEKGIPVVPDASLDGIIVKAAKDITVGAKFIKEGKVLKSINYIEANLSPVPLLNTPKQ